MAMIPYMAGGYAIDRMMGGDGKVGLALGTGAGAFGTGAIGGSALGGATASTSASTSPLLFSTPATAGGSGLGALGGAGMYEAGTLGTVNPLTTGGFSESISPFTPQGSEFGIAGSTNLFGSPISNQTVNSALTQNKGLLNRAIEDSYVQDGFDFINDGWEGMSLMDKANTGMLGSQAIDAANPAPQYPQVAPPQIAQRKPVATSGNPVSIQVGRRNTEFVDPEQLYKDRYRYA
jgi:hypothetical protein